MRAPAAGNVIEGPEAPPKGWAARAQVGESPVAARGGARVATDGCMTSDEERDLKILLERLRQEHRDLDVAIEALTEVTGSDVLQVQRLKKRKLQLKDRITHLEDQLFPDIIA